MEQLLADESSASVRPDHQALSKQDYPFQCSVWREKVAQWYYDVVDRIHESREVVYVAMNILDRHCVWLSNGQEIGKDVYERSAVTALFLAIRIMGGGRLEALDLLKLTRSKIGLRDITSTGKLMIENLTWDLRLLTPFDFIRKLLEGITLSRSSKLQVLEDALYLAEIAVCDSYFRGIVPSKIALAAISNAFQHNGCIQELTCFVEGLDATSVASPDCKDMQSIKSRMHEVFCESFEHSKSNLPDIVPGNYRDTDCHSELSRSVVRTVTYEEFDPTDSKRSRARSQAPSTNADARMRKRLKCDASHTVKT